MRIKWWSVVQMVIALGFGVLQMGGCPTSLDGLLAGQQVAGIEDVTASEAQQLIEQHEGDADFVILDVRTAAEYDAAHIEGAVNICSTCAASFAEELAPLDPDATYLVHCRSGNRSLSALRVMVELGFTHIYHMTSGLNEWIADGYPTVTSE